MTSCPDSHSDLAPTFEMHRLQLLRMIERRLPAQLRARIGADEILQETWLIASRRAQTRPRAGDVSDYAWLYGLTLDTMKATWRRETRRKRNAERDMPWPAESSIALGMAYIDSATSPSNAVARRELQQRVRHAVERLSESDREIIWMRHDDQLTHAEIAEIIGVSPAAANVRYFRALQKLKGLLTAGTGAVETG